MDSREGQNNGCGKMIYKGGGREMYVYAYTHTHIQSRAYTLTLCMCDVCMCMYTFFVNSKTHTLDKDKAIENKFQIVISKKREMPLVGCM